MKHYVCAAQDRLGNYGVVYRRNGSYVLEIMSKAELAALLWSIVAGENPDYAYV